MAHTLNLLAEKYSQVVSEDHDETNMKNPEERTEVHIARELLRATDMIIKIDLYNKEVKVIKEIEEGYLSEVKSVGGNVYDYEEYLIVDMNMEKVKSLAQELLKMHGQE